MSILNYLDWRHLFNRFFPVLTNLENKLFRDVAEFLDRHKKEVLLANIDEINHRTWGFEGSEAWYYKIHRFKINLDRDNYFKGQQYAEKIFSGTLKFPDGEEINFNMYALDQRFSHITFSSDPKKYRKASDFTVVKR